LVPLKSLDQAIADLPQGAAVSVTCSPAKGIAVTQELCEKLLAKGHNVVPHFAARLVDGPEHAKQLATWVREKGIKEVFIIGGDAEVPPHYQYALPFMNDFLAANPGVETIGFGAYPDGHSTISNSDLHNAVIEKEALLKEIRREGSCLYTNVFRCATDHFVAQGFACRRFHHSNQPRSFRVLSTARG
jgi:methylenetetrahydrofolate reductase (NADPH)